ncbi:MAG: lysylphosphatidylglycerol synthase transmembrane domain-containing protein, partial [Bacteroidetes bacterium]|nr:lysylphosphatidylglycerol synthase transmembrane domain-containing protein [Bacteroidota bacterium]
MAGSTRERWVHVASILLAVLLLWLALKGVEWDILSGILLSADYRWLAPIVGVTLLSHWLRALRWSLFLDTVPTLRGPEAGSLKRVSRSDTFISVMVGYMANYAGPRLGEVIRTVNVARRENRSFSAVLGTVVVERAVDMLTFGLCLLTLPLIYANQMAPLWSMLTEPLQAWFARTSPVLLWGGGLLLLGLSIAGVWAIWRGIRRSTRFSTWMGRFQDGLLSLARTGRTVQVILWTVAIWICYGLMAWLPFLMLGLNTPFDIGPVGAWGLMLIGAVGVI